MLSLLSSAAAPYLLYIKLGAVLGLILTMIAAGIYVKSVFDERDELVQDTTRLATELSVEKLKNTALLEQSERIAAMNRDILEAVKHVKINSSVYIDRVETTPLPAPVAGGAILVPGGMLAKTLPAAIAVPVVPPDRTAPRPP